MIHVLGVFCVDALDVYAHHTSVAICGFQAKYSADAIVHVVSGMPQKRLFLAGTVLEDLDVESLTMRNENVSMRGPIIYTPECRLHRKPVINEAV